MDEETRRTHVAKLLTSTQAWETSDPNQILFTFLELHTKYGLGPPTLDKLVSNLEAFFKSKGNSVNVAACQVLKLIRHAWNGGEGLEDVFLTSHAHFIAGVKKVNTLLKDDRTKKFHNLVQACIVFLETYAPLVPPDVVQDHLPDGLLPQVKEIIDKYTLGPARQLAALHDHVINLGDYRHDVLRYYQRYCEPFQQPLTKMTCGDPKVTLRRVQKELVRTLDETFKSAPRTTTELHLYRGVKVDGVGKIYLKGKAYNSTSSHFGLAAEFSGGKCCIMALSVPVGTPVLSINMRPDIWSEYEYLLPRNTVYVRDPTKDFYVSTDDGPHHVFGFNVTIDERFDFSDIDSVNEDGELPPLVNLQDEPSFIAYMFSLFDKIADQNLTYHQLVYDFLTRKVNVMLYQGKVYDEIKAVLPALMEEVHSDIILLAYTDLLRDDQQMALYEVIENMSVDNVLSGALHRYKGKTFVGEPHRLQRQLALAEGREVPADLTYSFLNV